MPSIKLRVIKIRARKVSYLTNAHPPRKGKCLAKATWLIQGRPRTQGS